MIKIDFHTARKNPFIRAFIFFLLHTQAACSQAPATVLNVIQPRAPQIACTTDTLKVMSLNMAHGRKDGMNQLLLSNSTIRDNLDDIALALVQSGADIVALQEADAPSRWSGNFDHIALLAEQADYAAVAHTPHASSWLFNYGTAILSHATFTETLNHTFEPSPPTMNKGFTLAQIMWQPQEEEQTSLLLDIISVHLDFSRKQVRESQTREITQVLDGRDNPTIILGDFNSDWLADELVIRTLANDNKLKGYRPSADDLATYPSGNKRLDWILISETLEFISYEVLPDVLSDHKAVVAEIGFSDTEQGAVQHTDQQAGRQ